MQCQVFGTACARLQVLDAGGYCCKVRLSDGDNMSSVVGWLLACLTSQQHVIVSQERICLDS